MFILGMGKSMFKLEVDWRDADRAFTDLPKITKKATANTLNVIVRSVNKNIRAHITATYNVPKAATRFGDLVSIRKANANRNIGTAIIYIKRRGRDLLEYGAVQVAEGLKVRVKTSTELIKGAFIAPLWKRGSDKAAMIKGKGRHAGNITRYTKSGKPYKAAKRQVAWGPQISTLYVTKAATAIMLKTIDDEYQIELDRQFKEQFEKKGRR